MMGGTMSHERHCEHCDMWYPVEQWGEDEYRVQNGHGQVVATIRTVECPGCRATLDAHSPPLRAAPRVEGGHE